MRFDTVNFDAREKNGKPDRSTGRYRAKERRKEREREKREVCSFPRDRSFRGCSTDAGKKKSVRPSRAEISLAAVHVRP